MSTIYFEKDFLFGAATSSYQIEGAFDRDGKGLSIWDEFVRKNGKIFDNTTGNISCAHYDRYAGDIKLMNKLGLQSYRFSISWPRIFPNGKGTINHKGLDFYDKLTDGLLSEKIEPFATLFHWDLPLELQKSGGWANRDIAGYFSDYAQAVARKLGDRIKYWVTINEPGVVFFFGYLRGIHAPGIKNIFKAFKAVHNMLLGHGKAYEAIKGVNRELKAGIANAFYPLYPESTRVKSNIGINNAFINKLFMDPVFFGHYPEELYNIINFFCRNIKKDDFAIIKNTTDFIGVNYYTRRILRNPIFSFNDKKRNKSDNNEIQFTEMGWEIFPQGLYDILSWINNNYNNPLLYITENGAAFPDKCENGTVRDIKRIEYIKKHLIKLKESIDSGVNVKGYFYWSLMDNFEWAYGLSKRFGLVYVDYKSLERTIKDSGYWYSNLCRNNSFSV